MAPLESKSSKAIGQPETKMTTGKASSSSPFLPRGAIALLWVALVTRAVAYTQRPAPRPFGMAGHNDIYRSSSYNMNAYPSSVYEPMMGDTTWPLETSSRYAAPSFYEDYFPYNRYETPPPPPPPRVVDEYYADGSYYRPNDLYPRDIAPTVGTGHAVDPYYAPSGTTMPVDPSYLVGVEERGGMTMMMGADGRYPIATPVDDFYPYDRAYNGASNVVGFVETWMTPGMTDIVESRYAYRGPHHDPNLDFQHSPLQYTYYDNDMYFPPSPIVQQQGYVDDYHPTTTPLRRPPSPPQAVVEPTNLAAYDDPMGYPPRSTTTTPYAEDRDAYFSPRLDYSGYNNYGGQDEFWY